MRKIELAVPCLVFVTAVVNGCLASVPPSGYCSLRAETLANEDRYVFDIHSMLKGDGGQMVRMEEADRQREFALFAKVGLDREGVAFRSILMFELDTIRAGSNVRVLPERPDLATCVERQQTRNGIDDCLSSLDVWRSVDVLDPGPCPVEYRRN